MFDPNRALKIGLTTGDSKETQLSNAVEFIEPMSVGGVTTAKGKSLKAVDAIENSKPLSNTKQSTGSKVVASEVLEFIDRGFLIFVVTFFQCDIVTFKWTYFGQKSPVEMSQCHTYQKTVS